MSVLPIIIVAGRFTAGTIGYGVVARNYYRALKDANLPVYGLDIHEKKVIGSPKSGNIICEESKGKLSLYPENTNSHVVVLSCETPIQLKKLSVHGKAKLFWYTMFETEGLPTEWVKPLLSVDQVWVPSEFNKSTFASFGIPEQKIQVMPICIDQHLYSVKQPEVRIDKNKFSLLAVISNFNRKDIGLLLRSYYQAFSSNDDVSLVIKLPPNVNKEDFSLFISDSVFPDYDIASPELPHVLALSGHISIERMRGLQAAVDVCVSIERGKGWDLPAMESMALGVPVIGIDWSANQMFMTDSNSFLVPPSERTVFVDKELVTNPKLYAGHTWSTAYESDIANAMRLAYDNRMLVKEKGLLAQIDVFNNFSYEKIASKIAITLSQYAPNYFESKKRAQIELK